MSAKSSSTSSADATSSARCGAGRRPSATPPRRSRGRVAGARRRGPPAARGSGASGSTMSTSFAISRNRSPRSARPTTTAGPGGRVEDEPDGVVSAADRQRVDLARRAAAGDRRADLEHVRAQHLGHGIAEVVGVVLHERRAAGQAVAQHLEDPDQRGRLPVALGPEAVAVGHQPLDADARAAAAGAPRSSNVSVNAPNAAVVEERPEARLDAGGAAQRGVPVAAGPQAGGRRRRPSRRRRRVRSTSASGTASTRATRSAIAVAVDREAEPRLRLDLVALGHGDLAHVVAEAGDLEPVRLVPADARRGPPAEAASRRAGPASGRRSSSGRAAGGSG